MGWGCYKHEMDAGSKNWKAAVEKATPPPYESWGRDEEVCPKCWSELKEISKDMLAALEAIEVCFDMVNVEDWPYWFPGVHTAIAKAKGDAAA